MMFGGCYLVHQAIGPNAADEIEPRAFMVSDQVLSCKGTHTARFSSLC